MSDALDAIVDIKEALAEYGSNITIKQITTGAFDENTGEKLKTVVDIETSALVRSYNSLELQDREIYATDMRFMLYTTIAIDYEDKLVFDINTYKINKIDKKILQNENLFYVIQGRL